MKIISSELYVKDNKVYHEGNKPKPKDIGAAPETHTHNYASATTPGGSAEHAIKATEDSLGQRIDTYIKGLSVSGRTITYTRGDGTTGTITTQDNNTDTKVTNTLNTTAKAYITGTTNSDTNTGTQVFDTNVYLDTTAGMLTATTFKGALQGNAATATSATSATSATQLATARTINGTSFNGTGNITTANWGTARNIQIGNSSKSVNGSSNMTWTLAEIGAAPDGHTHSYLPLTGGTMTGVITSSINTGTYLDGNKGKSIINSTNTAGGYIALIKSNSTNGYFTQATYQGNHLLQYTAKSTVDAGTNSTTKSAVLLNESGNTSFPGTVTAPTFSGALNGNATSSTSASHAAKLTTPRTINGTNFDGTTAITTSHWGTARTLTIGNTGKSVNGSGNVSWSIGEIGAAPAVHNHTSLTGITNLSFATDSSDAGSITTTIDGTNTYFDFNLSDDPAQNDMWRWRFTPSGGTLFNAMTLDAISTTEAKLAVTGEVQATRLKGTLTGNVTGNVTGTVSGNAGSATKLATPRAINGTNFDGTAAITTANWGTARTLTVGNASKSVNGSANVSWSLSEIGAAPTSHTHNSITNQDTRNVNTTPTQMPLGLSVHLKSNGIDGLSDGGNYHSTLMIKGWNDVSGGPWGQIAVTANNNLHFRSSNGDTWNAWKKVSLDGHTHNYAGSSSAGGAANSANTLATARTINGTSFNGSANITTANWGTARTLTIGNSGKSVNGSANVTWTLSEIGAAAASHTHSYLPLSGGSVTGRVNVGGRCILPPVYNYDKGALINICAAASQTMVTIHVTGNSYGAGLPINSMYHFYDYTQDGGIINASGVHNGYNIGNMTVYRNNGRLYAWIKQPASYQTFNIEIIANKTLDASISNAAVHTSGNTNTITITPSVASMNGHTHNYAGSSSAGGAANSATALATARTINGTSFNGTANITTANWGTARTLTIGNTGKSVNGSANISWTLDEMGAASRSPFSNTYKQITVGGDANTYYPVLITMNRPGIGYPWYNISISRAYNATAPDTWNNATHKGGLTFQFRWSGDTGWGGNDHNLQVVEFHESYTTMVAGFTLSVSGIVVWLRGGGALYQLNCEQGIGINATVTLGTYTSADDKTYPVRTNTNSVANEIRKLWVQRGGQVYDSNSRVYSPNNKPTPADIGAAATSHTHSNAIMLKSNHVSDWTSSSQMSGKTYVGGWHGSIGSSGKGYISLGLDGGASLDLFVDGELYAQENKRVYHTGFKPSPADIGAAASSHSHSYVPLSGGTLTGPVTVSGESKFHNGSYSDPWSGTGCAIKATGNIAATGIIRANQYLQVGGTPLSIQSSAPSCGGVWIQI